MTQDQKQKVLEILENQQKELDRMYNEFKSVLEKAKRELRGKEESASQEADDQAAEGLLGDMQ